MSICLELKLPATIGESPYWDSHLQELFWVDIPEKFIHRYNLQGKTLTTYSLPQQVGCIVPTDNPKKILAALENCYGFFDLDSNHFKPTGFLEEEYPQNRFNDGICDPFGRFIFGSMCPGDLPHPEAAVYQLEGTSCKKILDGFYTVNGLAFSPKGTTFYISDSHPKIQTVWAFDYDLTTGALSNRRIFFQSFGLAGRPDGAAVDEEGGYWIACIGGSRIIRLTSEGVVERSIQVPIPLPTKVAFGGKDLDTLFLTSKSSLGSLNVENEEGSLFSLKANVKGLKTNLFRMPS